MSSEEKELLGDVILHLSDIVEKLHIKMVAMELEIKTMSINMENMNVKIRKKDIDNVLGMVDNNDNYNNDEFLKINNGDNNKNLNIDINKNKTLIDDKKLKLIRGRRKII